ncbi:hypothetical protein LOZ43_006249, partial [Ophidiomyces ophidiicola]
ILGHDTALASPDADKQHRPGVEQANTYKRPINMEQAADIQSTTSFSNQILCLKFSNPKEGDLVNVPVKCSATNPKLTWD